MSNDRFDDEIEDADADSYDYDTVNETEKRANESEIEYQERMVSLAKERSLTENNREEVEEQVSDRYVRLPSLANSKEVSDDVSPLPIKRSRIVISDEELSPTSSYSKDKGKAKKDDDGGKNVVNKKPILSYNERNQSSSSKDIKQPILSYNERNQSSSSKDIKQQTSARTIDLTVEEESKYERDIAEATKNSLDQTELWKVVPVTSNSKFESMLLINNYV